MGAHFIDKFKASLTTTSGSAVTILTIPPSSIVGFASPCIFVVTAEVLSIRTGASNGGYSYRQGLFLYETTSLTHEGTGTSIKLGGDAVEIYFDDTSDNTIFNIVPITASSTEHVLMVEIKLQRG